MNRDKRRQFSEVRAILNRHDLMNLLEVGAPDDEYEPEAREIVDKLPRASGEQEVAQIVQEVFVKQFDERQNDDEVRAVAAEIWSRRR